jgi:hypothetical protein
MRRVDCRRCGVVAVEEVPWGDGKRTLTKAYMLFLARWARKMSWKETAEADQHHSATSGRIPSGMVITWSGLFRILSVIVSTATTAGMDRYPFNKATFVDCVAFFISRQIHPQVKRLTANCAG